MTINNSLLKRQTNGYTLRKNITITVSKNVIDKLKSIYINNGERGGLLWVRAMGANAEVFKISVFDNISGSDSSFEPNQRLFDNEIRNIISLGYLPMVFHTHPTNLGLNLYDNRRENFYLKASKPDRNISTQVIDEQSRLYMPECIFVKDNRFKGGYALAIYGGKILPTGFSRLSPLEFVVVLASGFLLYKGKFNFYFALAAIGIIIHEESQRPKYNIAENGNYVIKI